MMRQVFFKIGFMQLLVLVLGLVSCSSNKEPIQKIGFIENVKVFEEFEMKKDYDKKIENDLKNEVNILDSLQLQINRLSINNETSKIDIIKQEYFSKQEQYNKLFQELSSKYTTEVNNRLNEYIESFSEENNFDILLGSGGQGNVMFTKKEVNVTDKLIEYINKKYSN